jgi:hypothetical protein
MGKFIYIGEYPADGRSEAWGCVFTPGEAVEVPEQHVARARKNRFFVEATQQKADPVKLEAPAEPEQASDGKYAGFSREELIAQAEKSGVDIDKRWKTSKIADALIAFANSQA